MNHIYPLTEDNSRIALFVFIVPDIVTFWLYINFYILMLGLTEI